MSNLFPSICRGHGRETSGKQMARKIPGCASVIAWCGALVILAGIVQAQAPPTPWNQCPAVGAAPSCGILIVINADKSIGVYTDTSVGPYDGYDDTLIGVQNNSSQPLPSLFITSTKPSFAFTGDGICDTSQVPAPHPPGCPFGPTGYEGSGISFTVPGGVSQSACAFGYTGPWVCANDTGANVGTVTFNSGLAPGGYAYFGLQQPLTAQNINPSPPTPSATLRSITTTDTLPATCPGTPNTVSNFAPAASRVYVYFIVDGIQPSDALSDKWIGPQGSQYAANFGNSQSGIKCYSDFIDIAGKPPSGMPGTWNIQIYLNGQLLATVQFTITNITQNRVGVLAHVATNGGWITSISLINTSSSPVTVTVNFHGDDGSALALPLNFTGPDGSQSFTTSSVPATIGPNATVLIETVNQTSATLLEGWAEVLGSGPVGGFAIFRYVGSGGSASEGTVPLQTTFPAGLILPYDNTSGFVTGMAIANLSTSAANISATIWDANGSQIGAQSINLSGDGHGGYIVPNVFTVTAGQRGTIEFQNMSGGGLAGIGLRFSPFGTFTSVPIILLQ